MKRTTLLIPQNLHHKHPVRFPASSNPNSSLEQSTPHPNNGTPLRYFHRCPPHPRQPYCSNGPLQLFSSFLAEPFPVVWSTLSQLINHVARSSRTVFLYARRAHSTASLCLSRWPETLYSGSFHVVSPRRMPLHWPPPGQPDTLQPNALRFMTS